MEIEDDSMEEDLAFGKAMEEGMKEGIANEEEKQEFESFLFGAS